MYYSLTRKRPGSIILFHSGSAKQGAVTFMICGGGNKSQRRKQRYMAEDKTAQNCINLHLFHSNVFQKCGLFFLERGIMEKIQIMPYFDCNVWKIIIFVSQRMINSLCFYLKVTHRDLTPSWPLPALFRVHQLWSSVLGVQTQSSSPFHTDEITHVNLLDYCLEFNEGSISISELLPLF